jgi:c-di-GMP-related signal transduction protein
MKHLIIERKFKQAAIIVQARWRGQFQYKKFNNWKRRFLSLVRLLQIKFRNREKKKKKAVNDIIAYLKKLVLIRR